MNIFDEIYAFRTSEPFGRADIREPARIVLTLSPNAVASLLIDKRYHPGYEATPAPVHGLPWGVARQAEPWIAWIEYGTERRRFDRLARGLLNVGMGEQAEASFRSLITDYRTEERTYESAMRSRDFLAGMEAIVAQQAMKYTETAINELLDTYDIPFAVALMDDGVLIARAHTRHRDDEAIIERMHCAGRLVAAAQHLIPHERRVGV